MADLSIITQEEFEPFRELLEQLKDKVARLESLQEEWVSVKEAEKRTGKNRKTLLLESSRKDSLLKTKIEGKRKRLYSANSIINYNNRKVLKHREDHPLRVAS